MNTPPYRTAVFVDGENLVMRYQAMTKEGFIPLPGNPHRLDEFVWAPKIFYWPIFQVESVDYYTSAVGDDGHQSEVIDTIQRNLVYDIAHGRHFRSNLRLRAKVFKKKAKSQKSRIVDISLTLDALRAAQRPDIDQIYIISGDGDFLPVIQEIMRLGKRVMVGSLSSGLSLEMKRVPDYYENIDGQFFAPIDPLK